MSGHRRVILALMLMLLISEVSADSASLRRLSLAELLDIQVETASNRPQKLKNAPATMVVVTSEDIQRRGYASLQEVIADIPGFDVSILNSAYYTVSYQRGLRSLGPNRTLFMIDGIVSTLMWDAGSSLSRQYPLNHVERVEFLFGPASAVYGPNASSGIINVITKDATSLSIGENDISVEVQAGSFKTRGASVSLRGRQEGFSYSIGVKTFDSDEPDHSDRLGYLSNDWFSNRNVWGPILDFEVNGRALGSYYDPSRNTGLFAQLDVGDFNLNYQSWQTEEGYGPFYAADRVQNNVPWRKESELLHGRFSKFLSPKMELTTEFGFRSNFFGGDWVEAIPDWAPGQSQYSYISFTSWKTVSESRLFKQEFNYQWNSNVQFSGGINYEQKQLTKSYDIPGYWLGAYSSSLDPTTPGPHNLGAGIYHSLDPVYIRPPQPAAGMPSDNLVNTTDSGLYLLSEIDDDDWRYHLGIRFDNNSIYGASINPRFSIINDVNANFTLKAVYGEAFQEPPALELYGGWNGRNARPDLLPEELKSFELVGLYHDKSYNSQLSVYSQRMTNLIEFSGEQTSDIKVSGVEWRNELMLWDLFGAGNDMKTYFHYNYTDSQLDYSDGRSVAGGLDAGSIAPHKFYFGADVDLSDALSFGIYGRLVGERPYSQGNSLRGVEKVADYHVLDVALNWSFEAVRLTLKINNLLDEEYFAPDSGCGCAGLYQDDGMRSGGFTNPTVPQPKRAINLFVSMDY